MKYLGSQLQASRDSGRKLLVPYVMADSRPDWLDVVSAVVDAGADAVEVGMAFSDPVMDGPVIQAAAVAALDAGSNPAAVLDQLITYDSAAPLAVMTYYNVVNRAGLHRFADHCVKAGVSGAILPDLPFAEASPWMAVTEQAGLDNVMLVAPNTSAERLAQICDASRGFVYAVGTLGVTGQRQQLAASAAQIGDRARAVTTKPVLIGIGVSTPQQAVEAVAHSDGVVVGTAVVRACMDPDTTPAQVGELVSAFRSAIDAG